ncbi:MAG: glutaredoxin family protein [Chloroflexota bacterium]
MTAPPSPIDLYGRAGCHLCDDAHELLAALLGDRASRGLPAPTVTQHDIDTHDDLQRRYAFTIPVIAVAGRELELATSAAKIRRFLAETLDGEVPA